MTVEGTIPALLTPFTECGADVDLDALDRHVGWLHERGIRLASPMGTTGEGPSLSMAERKRVIERLAAHATGVELVVGTGATALPEAIELSRFAVQKGAAVLVAPPSYYEPYDARGVIAYFLSLLEALPGEARVFLYHIPTFTGIPITDETIDALRDRYGAMVAGVKDSSGDLAHTQRWIRRYPGLAILNGSDDNVAAAYVAGGRGVLTMLANVFPDVLEAIRTDVAAGKPVDELQRFLTQVRALVEQLPRHAALKYLLHLVAGLPRSSVRPPLQELDAVQEARLREGFDELKGKHAVVPARA